MIIQALVAIISGCLIGLSFYLSVKIVNKYLKAMENSRWKNFVIAIIGFILVMIILGVPFIFVALFTL